MEKFLQLFPSLRVWVKALSEKEAKILKRSFEKNPHQAWITYQERVRSNLQAQVSSADWACPDCFTLEDRKAKEKVWQQATARGIAYVQQGKVAALTVAGGLGTRLGFGGPKGLVPITPVKRKVLFQVFAEKLRAIERQYNVRLHWFIMTSPHTHKATWQAFKSNKWYDLHYVHLFQQEMLPAFTQDGLCLLKNLKTIHYFPDGHGGIFQALASSGNLECMERWGIHTLSYFQVDNPLVSIIDVGFLGMHLAQQSDLSTKVVSKVHPDEKVGVFVKNGDQLQLVEYSEMPIHLAQKRDAQGHVYFKYGNTAMHLVERKFLQKISAMDLPLHVIRKPVEHWDFLRKTHTLESYACKLERFFFDALRLARHPFLLEVDRKEEFSPVKNAEGQNSVQSCLRDQIERWQHWFNKNGIKFPIDLANENFCNVHCMEISPLFADDCFTFSQKWKSLMTKPDLVQGLYLE